jgi:hypothetical protein
MREKIYRNEGEMVQLGQPRLNGIILCPHLYIEKKKRNAFQPIQNAFFSLLPSFPYFSNAIQTWLSQLYHFSLIPVYFLPHSCLFSPSFLCQYHRTNQLIDWLVDWLSDWLIDSVCWLLKVHISHADSGREQVQKYIKIYRNEGVNIQEWGRKYKGMREKIYRNEGENIQEWGRK